MNDKLIASIKSMPDIPGVYLFKNKAGDIIYVGKAISLKKRLRSYLPGAVKGVKTERLMAEACSVDYIIRKDGEDALLLENNLIKENLPKYNIALRDDKTYPFVCISEKDGTVRVYVTRRKREKKAYYFGPYTNVKLLRIALKGLRYVYPYASCRILRKQGCVYSHIGLCPAPCIRPAGNAPSHFLKIIKAFSGDARDVVNVLMDKMNEASSSLNFEQAQEFLNMALAVNTILGKGKGIAGLGIADVFDLKDKLKLSRLPRRIEGVDISNLFGTYSVGSLVSFVDGRPDKKGYRRYKIKTVEGIDDFSMIKEVIKRRCRRLMEGKYPVPDLFLIDGGKGQLARAWEAVSESGLDIEVVSLAKEEELVFMPGRKAGIKLPTYSSALRLLQAVRDEAHRFALSYQHHIKKKGDFNSSF